ncbi:hypothetical protein EBZ37_14565, partial [bacterium]|nr:hypothetical protein [bacterium]
MTGSLEKNGARFFFPKFIDMDFCFDQLFKSASLIEAIPRPSSDTIVFSLDLGDYQCIVLSVSGSAVRTA